MLFRVVPAIVVLQLVSAAVDLPQEWTAGEASLWGGADLGQCGFGTQVSKSFPFSFYGAPDNVLYAGGAACGACFEVKCTGAAGAGTCDCTKETVVLQVNTEGRARADDTPHLQITRLAFGSMISNNLNKCVDATIEFRRVDCPYNAAGVPAAVDFRGGVSSAQFIPRNIAGFGTVTQFEMRVSGSADWHNCTRYGPAFTCMLPLFWKAPASLRMTDPVGNTVTGIDVVTNTDSGEATLNFTANFEVTTAAPVPASTPTPTASPTPTPASTPEATPTPQPTPVPPTDSATCISTSLAVFAVAAATVIAF